MDQLSDDDPGSEPLDGLPLAKVVARACRGEDLQAFDLLYTYFEGSLWRYLKTLLRGDAEAANDLYQDTFFRVWQFFLGTTMSEETIQNFKPWLYTIARNIAIDYLRRKKKINFQPLPEDEPYEISNYGFLQLSTSGHEDIVCESLRLEEAIAAMTPKYQVCWVLQVQWGYSQREIASALGISESAVSTNVCRGYQQLRDIYLGQMNGSHKERKGAPKRHGKNDLRPF